MGFRRSLVVALAAWLCGLALAANAIAADTIRPTAVLEPPATTVLPGAAIHLSGAKSFDVGGSVVQYRWTVANRPVVVTSESAFDAPGLAAGTYSASLVVVDDSGNQSAADTKQIVVQDKIAPTAVLQVPTSAAAGTAIHLTAAKSFDVGGSIAQYRWTVAGRATVVTDTPAFDAPGLTLAGTYPASLVVVDDSGNASSADTQQIVVTGDIVAPTAVLELPASAAAGTAIHLTGAKSFDIGGSVVQYRWTVAARPTVVTDAPAFDAPGLGPGAYAVSLTVVDDSGNQSAPDTKQLIVVDTTAPTAVLVAPGSVVAGATIPLSGAKSFDVGGTVAQYRWTVAGRATVVTDGPAFDAPGLVAGSYQLSLAVVDTSGNQSTPTQLTLAVTPDATKVTTFGRLTLFAPEAKRTSQILLSRRTLLAGRIFAPVAGRLSASFSLKRHGAAPLALGHASLVLHAGDVQRLKIQLASRALKTLRGRRHAVISMRVTVRESPTAAATTQTRSLTFSVNP